MELITLKKYQDLEDKSEYDFALKYSGIINIPVDGLEIGDITEYTFGLVKDMQYQLDKGLSFEHALDFFKQMGKTDLGNKDLFLLNRTYKYLVSEISRVNGIEAELLSGSVSDAEISAGIEDLNELSVYLQLRQIALTFHMTIEQARALPYNDGLIELITQKRLKDFEKNLIRLQKK